MLKLPFVELFTEELMCTDIEFFNALRNQTFSYETQTFLQHLALDGAVVSIIKPPHFKLWPRVRGNYPVVSGVVVQSGASLIIRFQYRLPYQFVFGMAWSLLLVFAFLIPRDLAAFAFFFCLIFIFIFLVIYSGRAEVRRMKNLMERVLAEATRQKSGEKDA